MELNERTDLTTLANTVRKKVNGLIGVYSLLILLTILLFLVVTAVIALILWGLYLSDALYGRLVAYGLLVIGAAGYCLVVVLKPLIIEAHRLVDAALLAHNLTASCALLYQNRISVLDEDKPHNGEEFGYLMSGRLTIHLGEKIYHVKSGESFYYQASQKHRIENSGSRPAKFLWISTPPEF